MTIETCSSSAPDLAQNMRLRWTIRLVKGRVTRRVQLWLSTTLAAGCLRALGTTTFLRTEVGER